MELASIEHISRDKLSDIQIDLFITTLSHEERSCHIAREIESKKCRKIAFINSDSAKEFRYNENLEYFRLHDYEFHAVTGETPEIDRLMEAEEEKRELNLLVDFTCMSQPWYYALLNWFSENEELESVRMRVGYTLSEYEEDNHPLKVKGIKDFARIGAPRKKSNSALILGLGQEAKVTESILKRIKPDLLILFYADPAADKRFVEKVFVNNHAVIERTPIRHFLAYPVQNAQTIYQILSDTILPLRDDYSITVIPQGPKIFSLVSMLVQLGYPEINLSYPIFKKLPIQDRIACSEPVILDLILEGEE